MDLPLFLVPELMAYVWVPIMVAMVYPMYKLLSLVLILVSSKRV